MSIVVATVVATVVGIGARNVTGWLRSTPETPFDLRQAAASGIIGVVVGIPVVAGSFSALFESIDEISEIAQLSAFVLQIAAIAGFEALAKGTFKASQQARNK